MDDLNRIVAANLIDLRKKSGLTQQQLAEKFSYSDKTVSKWELGHAIPSVDVLKNLADFYGVSVDYILKKNETVADIEPKKETKPVDNKLALILLTNSIFLIIATVIFVWTCLASKSEGSSVTPYWQIFIWAGAVCFGVSTLLVRKIWKTRKTTILVLASLFVWTLITAFYLQFLNENVWYIYFIGIPVELSLIIISRLK